MNSPGVAVVLRSGGRTIPPFLGPKLVDGADADIANEKSR
jgi:hypothetical protein